MTEEIWKSIKGYEGLYEVSNLGRIKSLEREWISGKGTKRKHPDIILKNIKDKKGYSMINLLKNSKSKTFKIHRLVMNAFYGDSDLQVNHINGIKHDNSLINLEYCTGSENMKHAYKIGLEIPLKGEKKINSKLNNEIVKNIRENKYNLSRKEFSVLYDVHISVIDKVINNKTWRHVS